MKSVTLYLYEGDDGTPVGDEIAIVERTAGPPPIGAVILLEQVKYIVTYVEWHMDLIKEEFAELSWVNVRMKKHE